MKSSSKQFNVKQKTLNELQSYFSDIKFEDHSITHLDDKEYRSCELAYPNNYEKMCEEYEIEIIEGKIFFKSSIDNNPSLLYEIIKCLQLRPFEVQVFAFRLSLCKNQPYSNQ